MNADNAPATRKGTKRINKRKPTPDINTAKEHPAACAALPSGVRCTILSTYWFKYGSRGCRGPKIGTPKTTQREGVRIQTKSGRRYCLSEEPLVPSAYRQARSHTYL